MRKILILLIATVFFGCSLECDKSYSFAGYVISFNQDGTVTFCGLEKKWTDSSSFYVPADIYGKKVTNIAYDSSATWDGCSSIYIPSTVNIIDSNSFRNNAGSLLKIYWDKSGVTASETTFLPSEVNLYVKSNGKYVNIATGESDGEKTNKNSAETLIYDLSEYQESGNIGTILNNTRNTRYSDGVLTIYPFENGKVIDTIHFKGTYMTRSKKDNHLIDSAISGLCIKLSESWTSTATIIFENFAFESSKGQPLIDSPVDLVIEYQGNNNFSSSASETISLIRSLKSIEFKAADSNSAVTIKPNQVTNKDCYQGSIAVEAENRVTIDGGTFIIERGDGWNNDEEGRIGGDGSSGIKATETVIKNNAVVNITSGDGANGNDGKDNSGVISAKGDNTTGPYQTADKGDPGIPGGDAGNGGNGGTAIIGKLTVVSGNIILSGGKGGDGGTGGQGGHGGQGGDNGWVGGTNGDGGDGGKGGKAGRGGNGGDAINGQFENQNHCLVKLFEGKCGENGTPGIGGIEGVRGWHYNVGGTFGHHGCSGAPGERGDPADDPPPCDGVQHR